MFMSRLSLFWLSAHESCTQELADPRSYCFGHVWVCGHDWSGGGWAPHQAVLGIRAELAFLFFSVPQTPPLTQPFICSVFSLSPPIRMFLHSTVPVCSNVQSRCWKTLLLSNIYTLYSFVYPFSLLLSFSVHPPWPGDLLTSQLSHPSPLALALPTLGHLSWTRRGAPGPASPRQSLQSPLCGSQQTSVGSAKVY